MLKRGDRPQDYPAADLSGKPQALHGYRRKAHVLLIVQPTSTEAERSAWREKRAAESQRWTWLQAEALAPAAPLVDFDPGLYLISRWGAVIAVYPAGLWDMDRIEKDLLTFESQDACGVKLE